MVAEVHQVFPCMVTAFPCKYLGIPLSLKRLARAQEQLLVDEISMRIPTWKSGLLTNAGRVLLTKVTLSAIPVHVSIACCLSQWAIGQIDRRRRAFIWTGTESTSGGKCKVAWASVCRPAGLGGLGVLDLRYFGFALRLRWEWLRRTDTTRCWSSLPARAEKPVAAMSAASMSVQVGDGAATKLWTDSWSSVGLLCLYAPQLFAALTRRGKSLSLKDGIYMNQWAREISGALTTPVLYQYVMVWELLRGVILVPTQADRFVWKWSPDGRYSASSAYRAFFQGSCSLLGASELWRARAPPKVSFSFG
jgi:hypothetical protein